MRRGPRTTQHVVRPTATLPIVEGAVEGFVPGGFGLLHHDDKTVFVRGALKGERVRVQLDSKRGQAFFGHVIGVDVPSHERVIPDCALHPRCGGCDWLDLSALAQRAAKEEVARDALRRIAKLEADALPLRQLAVASAQAQRRRARFVVGAGGALTYSGRESHTRVAIDRCAALHPSVDEARAAVVRAVLPPGIEVRLAVDDRAHVSCALTGAPPQVLAAAAARIVAHGAHGVTCMGRTPDDDVVVGDPVLRGELAPGVAGGPFASDAAVFTQATRAGGQAILDAVLDAARVRAGDVVLELFAGSGHLTLGLRGHGAHVHAVEGDARAVRYLEKNLAQQTHAVGNLPAATFSCGYIDGSLALPAAFRHPDIVVCDPPRTGMPDTSALVTRLRPRRLVLVSCDVATGARDLRAALMVGYRLHDVAWVDAFPRTSHLEWIATLHRADL